MKLPLILHVNQLILNILSYSAILKVSAKSFKPLIFLSDINPVIQVLVKICMVILMKDQTYELNYLRKDRTTKLFFHSFGSLDIDLQQISSYCCTGPVKLQTWRKYDRRATLDKRNPGRRLPATIQCKCGHPLSCFMDQLSRPDSRLECDFHY